MLGLLARHTPARTTGRCRGFTVHPLLGKQIDTADLGLYRGGIGVGVDVRVPDVGVTAREQSDTAANRYRIRRVPSETEAWQDQVEVIQRRVVGEAVVGDKVRVDVGLVTGLVPVVAQADRQFEPVGDLPLVLNVGRIHRVAPLYRGVALVITDRVAVVNPCCLTRRKVLNAIKTDFGINVLVEQVVHLQVFPLKATSDGVVTHRIGATNHQLLNFPVERVRLSAIVLTEVHVHFVELDAELGEVLARHSLLQEVDVAEGVADLGGETVVPVGIPVDVVGGELSTALVEVLVEFELIQITV